MAPVASAPARELSSIDFESMLGGPLVAVVNAQAKAAMSTVNFIKAVGFRSGSSEDPTKPDTGEPIYVSFRYPKEIMPYRPAQSGEITGINVTDKGGGYDPANPPQVTIDPPADGTAATVNVTVLEGGKLDITLNTSGTGYMSDDPPKVNIPGPAGGDGAKQAVASCVYTKPQKEQQAQYQTMTLEVPFLTMVPIPFIRIEETTIDFNAKINSVEEMTTDSTFKASTESSGKVKYPPLFSIASAKLKVNTSYQRNTSSGTRVERTYSMAVHIRAVQDEIPEGMERLLGILEDAMKSYPAELPAPA